MKVSEWVSYPVGIFQPHSSSMSTEKSDPEEKEEKSDVYSKNMTQAMGAGE